MFTILSNLFFTSLALGVLSWFFMSLVEFTFGSKSKVTLTLQTIAGFFLVLTPILLVVWFLNFLWNQ